MILVETGITFEKQAIKDWFKKGRHRNCPSTNRPVNHVQLVSNLGLKQVGSCFKFTRQSLSYCIGTLQSSARCMISSGLVLYHLDQSRASYTLHALCSFAKCIPAL